MSLLADALGGYWLPAARRRIVPPADPDEPLEPLPAHMPYLHCRPCDVKWRGGVTCWNCGQPTGVLAQAI